MSQMRDFLSGLWVAFCMPLHCMRRHVILFAAWWCVHVSDSVPPLVAHWLVLVGLKLWPRYAKSVGNFMQRKVLPLLLADWLFWPIAENYLRAKWEAERLEKNRRFLVVG